MKGTSVTSKDMLSFVQRSDSSVVCMTTIKSETCYLNVYFVLQTSIDVKGRVYIIEMFQGW